jgi:hypothetical protein
MYKYGNDDVVKYGHLEPDVFLSKILTSLMAVWAMLGPVKVTNEMLQGKMQLV